MALSPGYLVECIRLGPIEVINTEIARHYLLFP